MPTPDEVIEALDRLMPHPWSVVITAIVVPCFLWLIGFRWEWRKDQREEEESASTLMLRVAQTQRSELVRMMSVSDALQRQVQTLSDGRYRLQETLDGMREQMIAARVLIHDYERRLGLPETEFPPLMTTSVIDRKAV